MATTTDVPAGVQMIALGAIRTDRNVRQQLIAEQVDALAQSIELLGQLTPVSVRPAEDGGYVLITGHKRYAALAKLGKTEIRAELRADDSQEESERAAENIVRSGLNPYEEAVAVRAMLERGLTEDGAAQALGWNRARISARVKLLALPERAQQLVGAGTIPLSAVDQLQAIGGVSAPLLEAVIAYVDDGNEWAAERLAREPGWVLDSALREQGPGVFAAHLTQVDSYELAQLRLGKRTEALVEEAAALYKQLDRYAYGAPPFRFTEQDVDQARAAGVVIEFERSTPIIVDRALYRQLAKDAIARTTEQLREKVAAAATEKRQARKRHGGADSDPLGEARREHGRRLRELGDQAHGVNLDLGAGLLKGLATVDPSDIDVARFFVFAVLGSDYHSAGYGNTGERIARLAVSGIRLVIDEFRTDVTKTLKDGSRGRLRIAYEDPHKPEKPIAWLWKFIDGAKTAGELYGRALVVIAAEQHASRLVVPNSQRTHPSGWSSHKGIAAKALAKLAGPHVPASLKQLGRSIDRAEKDYRAAEETARKQAAKGVPERDDQDGEPDVEASEDLGDCAED
jgi:ParB/RepB/Spo0J family partition protein